ncbi:MAG: M24 family metallopeptidase [Nitrososphaerota archaeon]|nr:M24 family metallopeptidase [Nitrososphaerota archaeon]
MSIYSQRRKRILAAAKGRQVAVFSAPNLFYLTDFLGGGAGIVLPDKTVVVTSPLEADRSGEMCKEAEIVVAKRWKDVEEVIGKHLEKGKVLVDHASPQSDKRFEAHPEMFVEVRRTKDELEIQRIRKACAFTDKTYDALERVLKPGKTEWELAAEVMKTATELGMTPSNSESSLGPIIIASGPHGAYGHSELSDRKVRSGDFVVADLFFRYEGYNSDETRTFGVGSVTSEMKKHYSIVREAQEAAMAAAREGVSCGAVNDAAVDVLKRNRMDKYLNHSVGHGVGIDIHEMPGIFHGNKVKLMRNDVITDEPGVYLVGKYGIRIEDTLLIGKRVDTFTKYTKDLVICG